MPFYTWDEIAVRNPRPGQTAQVLGGEKIQVARVRHTGPAAFPRHSHAENEQVSFVLAGQITFTVGEESRRLRPGGVIIVPAGVPHSNRVDEGDYAEVIEVFCPPREDL